MNWVDDLEVKAKKNIEDKKSEEELRTRNILIQEEQKEKLQRELDRVRLILVQNLPPIFLKLRSKGLDVSVDTWYTPEHSHSICDVDGSDTGETHYQPSENIICWKITFHYLYTGNDSEKKLGYI